MSEVQSLTAESVMNWYEELKRQQIWAMIKADWKGAWTQNVSFVFRSTAESMDGSVLDYFFFGRFIPEISGYFDWLSEIYITKKSTWSRSNLFQIRRLCGESVCFPYKSPKSIMFARFGLRIWDLTLCINNASFGFLLFFSLSRVFPSISQLFVIVNYNLYALFICHINRV